MEKEFKIYCYTNKYTGEKYIGSTCKTLKSRAGKNGREYCKTNTKFKRAIEAYGWQAFDLDVIDVAYNDREASRLERYYINIFQTSVDGIGYNGNKGGAVPTHKGVKQFLADGTIIAIYTFIKDASNVTGISISSIIDCCNKRIKTAGGFIWRYTEEADVSFNEIEITPFSGERRVDQISLDGEFIRTFDSAKDAESETGALRSKICMCCKGNRKTAGGYKWRYTDGFGLKDIYGPKPSRVRKIAQYSIKGDLIAIYKSQSHAHRETGFSAGAIAKACKSGRNEFAGYVWKYID